MFPLPRSGVSLKSRLMQCFLTNGWEKKFDAVAAAVQERKGDFVFCQCCWRIEARLKNSPRQGGNDEMKFGHDVLDWKPQICICSGECETVLPPACVRAHPACSISAHLARSIRINCISARERARWIEREGERFSPSVGLVLLQGESFKILPPMWLLVFTLMTPLLSPYILSHDFPGFEAASSVSCADAQLICDVYK